MRLHRRKEAGVVVDFAEPGAPHTERVITLHSLLDVDAYRPNGLVTPPPPRRRRWRRRPPKPLVKEGNVDRPRLGRPRAADRRDRQPVAAGGRVEAAAGRAARMGRGRRPRRRRRPTCSMLAERIAGLQPEARELFFFTCAAENKHRKLRLQALGDLASHNPSQTTFAMACRLVEAAPDLAAGPRPGSAGAAAGAGRRQDRGAGRPDRRLDVAAGARRPRPRVPVCRAATSRTAAACWARWRRHPPSRPTPRPPPGWCRSRPPSPLEAGAAILAVASPRRDTTAERLVERGRGGAVRRLAAAGRGARLEHSRARRRAPSSAKRAKQKERAERGGDGLVQRRRGRLDAAGRAAPPRGRRRGWSRCRPQVAVRLRDDADEVVAARQLARAMRLIWQLAGDGERRFETAGEVRSAAAEVAPLEISVGKLLGESRARRPHGPGGRGRRRPGGAAEPRGGRGAARRRRPPGARPS